MISVEIVFIRYASELSAEEIDRLSQERSDNYRAMDGLLQKYYIHNEESDRFGGIYVFDSSQSADALFESDINASLRDVYSVTDIEIERFPVMFPLYEPSEVPA